MGFLDENGICLSACATPTGAYRPVPSPPLCPLSTWKRVGKTRALDVEGTSLHSTWVSSVCEKTEAQIDDG